MMVTELDLDDAQPGERCEFHPDCCDLDNPHDNCTGCGQPAERTIIFRRPLTTIRYPICAEHRPGAAQWIIEQMAHQRAQAN